MYKDTFHGNLPVIVLNEKLGILLLCFRKEIHLLLVVNGGFQPSATMGRTVLFALNKWSFFYTQRSGTGSVLD